MQRPMPVKQAVLMAAGVLALTTAPVGAQDTADSQAQSERTASVITDLGDMDDPTAPPARLIQSLLANEQQSGEDTAAGDEQASVIDPGPSLIVEQMMNGDWQRRAVIGNQAAVAGEATPAGPLVAVRESSVTLGAEDERRAEAVINTDGVSKTTPSNW